MYRQSRTPRSSRVWRFALVGLGGFVIQILVLAALTRVTALDYRVATIFAVEAAVLHNFVWHERWTWQVPKGAGSRMTRAARFHTTTALLSLVGNVVLMSLFVELLEWPVLLANLVAVAILAVANFQAADSWVFRGSPLVVAAGLLLVAGPALAGPPTDTVTAWTRYVAMTERRIAELGDGPRFLAMDVEVGGSQRDRRRLGSGEVLIEPITTGGSEAGGFEVPGGMIHHWRGCVFIPGAWLDAVLNNPTRTPVARHRHVDWSIVRRSPALDVRRTCSSSSRET